MFVIETTILILGILALSVGSFVREYIRQRRDRRQAKTLDGTLERLRGRGFADARGELGFPHEVVEGLSGRRLYIWKVIEKKRVLTVTLTAEPSGRIVDAAWKKG